VGASIPETIFDAGLRRATVQQYVATYNADLAGYRQTVLSAFQQVEDSLAEVRILSKEIQQEQQAVNLAQTYLKLEQARYETGVDPYVDVLIAQTTVLADQQILNSLQVQQMTSAVALVEALGGGWDRSQLPNTQQVTQKPAKSETTIEH
jgi:outer membrane protein TolC